MEPTSTYRADIDGLRAVAVLAVIIFHLNPHWLPGGFAGVDMFFVISGFLITGIIRRDIASEVFRFDTFYARRFRRLLPPVFGVIAVSTLLAAALYLPNDALSVFWSAVASATWTTNFYFTFFAESGYFATTTEIQPLLHLWSLSVEEQFYLLWPLIVLLLSKAKRFEMPAYIAIAAASFFLASVLNSRHTASFAYYMLPTRAFQLAAGAIAALSISTLSVRTVPHVARMIILCLGTAAVTASFIFLNSDTPYPGPESLPVTLGTAALVMFAPDSGALKATLENKGMVFVGRISYSLYLWHWPVLAFQRYFDPILSAERLLTSTLLTFALAIVSYYMLENSIRRRDWSLKKSVALTFIFPTAAVAIVLVPGIASSGVGPLFGQEYTSRLLEISNNPSVASRPYVCQASAVQFELWRDDICIGGAQLADTEVLLYGDSHAAHFVEAMNIVGEEVGLRIRNIAHAACPPMDGDVAQVIPPAGLHDCMESQEVALNSLPSYKNVIIAARWYIYDTSVEFRAGFQRLLDRMINEGHRIAVIGSVPFYPDFDAQCAAKAVKFPILNCDDLTEQPRVPSPTNEWLKQIAQESESVLYLDPSNAFCDANSCGIYAAGKPIYSDMVGHLSLAGSRYIGERMIELGEATRIRSFFTADPASFD